MSVTRPAFARLAVAADQMTARIMVARLESEGIEARVLGEGLGPYRVTLGDLATSEVWVAEDRIEDARRVLSATELDVADDPTNVQERALPKGMILIGLLALAAVVVYRVLAALL